ncbi:DUF4280 domain-containing protein [Sphingomonas sp. 28-63-12]|uniref:DUF4280 domain-containing protein n=1 Tax=Sphingomonas sp. 28-63-12 TaxID=1970434 RepID=UPI0035A843BE
MSTPDVTATAMLQCSFGAAPAPFVVLPINRVTACNFPSGTIMDNIPLVNITPFGMCQSPSNPTVIAATAAALGVFTPMPCVPVTVAPWTPGTPTVTIANLPALDTNCKLMCAWAGVIGVQQAAQFTVTVP